MAYQHEIDEWHRAAHDLSETEREINADSHRAALGIIGEEEDEK